MTSAERAFGSWRADDDALRAQLHRAAETLLGAIDELSAILAVEQGKPLDAAVIGVRDDDMGNQLKAVVELNPGIDPTDVLAAELIVFCNERLAKFKCPRSVDFEVALPRLPTGKLLRLVLRDRYAEPQRP
jgi:acyl-coenzyme A synthetase/AMP-(fatty) acid ligase